MKSVCKIFELGTVFLSVRNVADVNGVRPNGIRAPTSFRVSSCGRNTLLLYSNYVRACNSKLSQCQHRKNAVISSTCLIQESVEVVMRLTKRNFSKSAVSEVDLYSITETFLQDIISQYSMCSKLMSVVIFLHVSLLIK